MELMGAIGQGFVDNGFCMATATEFDKRRNPQCAICFDACGHVCHVLSLPCRFQFFISCCSGLVALRFESIAGPQASLFQVALISHLRFNALGKQVQCVHARMQLASYEDLHATSPCDRLHQAGAI